MNEPAFTIGLEEEYLLVDRKTRDLAQSPPDELFAECERLLPGQVTPEFLRAQIEVQTGVHATVEGARADLARLRRTVAEVANRHGLAPIAAATHPFARWAAQQATQRARYQALEDALQAPGRRLVICGLHVHVGIEDDELRIDLMNQVAYFLPHLLALSTSSPFWQGVDTGLMSYRLAVFNELPRTGPPEYFESWGEYQRQLGRMVGAGLIEDATKLWWDARPSARFPTLEMRITDVATRLDDAIAIAALYQALITMLYRLRRANQRWRVYPHMLIKENRWRAQRHGFDKGLVDFGKGAIVPFADLLEELLVLLAPDLERHGAREAAHGARDILARGTSAHRQRANYQRARAAGADHDGAMRAVVDWLIDETVLGL